METLLAGREVLEQQKAYHRECIRAINTQLNALAPVSRLTPEVLSEIFLHHAGYRTEPTSRAPQLREWIQVTHVCTHWREVALQCTTLWSRLQVPGPPAVCEEFLARSKDAPLSMSLSFHPIRGPGSKALESSSDVLLALSALHRVQALSLRGIWLMSDSILERLRGPAPLLESLSVSGASDSLKPTELCSSITCLLLHGNSSRLHTLDTKIHTVEWSSIPSFSLTHLAIQGDYEMGRSIIESFLKALTRMPHLETLHLKRLFVPPSRAQTETIYTLPAPAVLPRLRLLHSEWQSAHTTAVLLNQLHTPVLTRLSVDVMGSRVKRDNILLFTAMAQKTATLGPFLTVAFPPNDMGETSIHLYRDNLLRPKDPKDDCTVSWLEQHVPALRYDGGDNIFGKPLAEFCRLIAVGHAQTLLFGNRFPGRNEWLDLTQYTEQVTELRLHNMRGDLSPGKWLKQRRRGDTGHGRARQFVLPNLRTFTMDSFYFLEDPVEPGEHQERRTGLISELQACFTQRTQEGAEIETLRILHARRLRQEGLERLREVVRCVEWDGRLGEPNSFDNAAFSVARRFNASEALVSDNNYWCQGEEDDSQWGLGWGWNQW